jgi:hypothetical protein
MPRYSGDSAVCAFTLWQKTSVVISAVACDLSIALGSDAGFYGIALPLIAKTAQAPGSSAPALAAILDT